MRQTRRSLYYLQRIYRALFARAWYKGLATVALMAFASTAAPTAMGADTGDPALSSSPPQAFSIVDTSLWGSTSAKEVGGHEVLQSQWKKAQRNNQRITLTLKPLDVQLPEGTVHTLIGNQQAEAKQTELVLMPGSEFLFKDTHHLGSFTADNALIHMELRQFQIDKAFPSNTFTLTNGSQLFISDFAGAHKGEDSTLTSTNIFVKDSIIDTSQAHSFEMEGGNGTQDGDMTFINSTFTNSTASSPAVARITANNLVLDNSVFEITGVASDWDKVTSRIVDNQTPQNKKKDSVVSASSFSLTNNSTLKTHGDVFFYTNSGSGNVVHVISDTTIDADNGAFLFDIGKVYLDKDNNKINTLDIKGKSVLRSDGGRLIFSNGNVAIDDNTSFEVTERTPEGVADITILKVPDFAISSENFLSALAKYPMTVAFDESSTLHFTDKGLVDMRGVVSSPEVLKNALQTISIGNVPDTRSIFAEKLQITEDSIPGFAIEADDLHIEKSASNTGAYPHVDQGNYTVHEHLYSENDTLAFSGTAKLKLAGDTTGGAVETDLILEQQDTAQIEVEGSWQAKNITIVNEHADLNPVFPLQFNSAQQDGMGNIIAEQGEVAAQHLTLDNVSWDAGDDISHISFNGLTLQNQAQMSFEKTPLQLEGNLEVKDHSLLTLTSGSEIDFGGTGRFLIDNDSSVVLQKDTLVLKHGHFQSYGASAFSGAAAEPTVLLAEGMHWDTSYADLKSFVNATTATFGLSQGAVLELKDRTAVVLDDFPLQDRASKYLRNIKDATLGGGVVKAHSLELSNPWPAYAMTLESDIFHSTASMLNAPEVLVHATVSSDQAELVLAPQTHLILDAPEDSVGTVTVPFKQNDLTSELTVAGQWTMPQATVEKGSVFLQPNACWEVTNGFTLESPAVVTAQGDATVISSAMDSNNAWKIDGGQLFFDADVGQMDFGQNANFTLGQSTDELVFQNGVITLDENISFKRTVLASDPLQRGVTFVNATWQTTKDAAQTLLNRTSDVVFALGDNAVLELQDTDPINFNTLTFLDPQLKEHKLSSVATAGNEAFLKAPHVLVEEEVELAHTGVEADVLEITTTDHLDSGQYRVHEVLKSDASAFDFGTSYLDLEAEDGTTGSITIPELTLGGRVDVNGSWTGKKAVFESGADLNFGAGSELQLDSLRTESGTDLTLDGSSLFVEGVAGDLDQGYGLELGSEIYVTNNGHFTVGPTAAAGLAQEIATVTDAGADLKDYWGSFKLDNLGELKLSFDNTVELSTAQLQAIKKEFVSNIEDVPFTGILNLGDAVLPFDLDPIDDGTGTGGTDPSGGAGDAGAGGSSAGGGSTSPVVPDTGGSGSGGGSSVPEIPSGGGSASGGSSASGGTSPKPIEREGILWDDYVEEIIKPDLWIFTNERLKKTPIIEVDTTDQEFKGHVGSLVLEEGKESAEVGSGSLNHARSGAFVAGPDGDLGDILVKSEATFVLNGEGAVRHVVMEQGTETKATQFAVNGPQAEGTESRMQDLSGPGAESKTEVLFQNNVHVIDSITGIERLVTKGHTHVEGEVSEVGTLQVQGEAVFEKDVGLNALEVKEHGSVLVKGEGRVEESMTVAEHALVKSAGSFTLAKDSTIHGRVEAEVLRTALSAEPHAIVLDNGGEIRVKELIANKSNVIFVGPTKHYSGSASLIAEKVDLNQAKVFVDPSYGGEHAKLLVGRFSDGSGTGAERLGVMDGTLFVGQNAIAGIGFKSSEEWLQHDFVSEHVDEHGSLEPALGAMMLLKDRMTVGAGEDIYLKAVPLDKIFTDPLYNHKPFDQSYPQDYSVLTLGEGAALVLDMRGHDPHKAFVTFAADEARVVQDKGKIILLIDTVADRYTVLDGKSIYLVDMDGAEAEIPVETANALLKGKIYQLEQGKVSDVVFTMDKAKARETFNQASLPVVETLVDYLSLGASGGSNALLLHASTETAGAEAETAARLQIYGGSVVAALQNQEVLHDAITQHLDRDAAFHQSQSMAENENGASLWLEPLYREEDASGYQAIGGLNYGYEYKLKGMVLGADRNFGTAWRVGAAFSLSEGKSEGTGAASAVDGDYDAYALAAYLQWQPNENFGLRGTLSYGEVSNDIEAATNVERLTSKVESENWTAEITAYAQVPWGNWSVMPYVGLRYSLLELDDSEVQGQNVYACLNAKELDYVTIPVGLRFSTEFEHHAWTLSPSAEIWGSFAVGDTELESEAKWTGVASLSETELTTEVRDESSYGVRLGIDLMNGPWNMLFQTEYIGSEHSDAFGLRAQMVYRF